MIRRQETISDKGILNAIGKSMPFQILIFICSKPNVRSMPASSEINALKISPAYKTDITGSVSKYKKLRMGFIISIIFDSLRFAELSHLERFYSLLYNKVFVYCNFPRLPQNPLQLFLPPYLKVSSFPHSYIYKTVSS